MLRPRGSDVNKFQSWWVGPYRVVRRAGELSYQITDNQNLTREVHYDQIKIYVYEIFNPQEGTTLVFESPSYQALQTGLDEWEVYTILAHRVGSMGSLEFLTRWEGSPLRRGNMGTRPEFHSHILLQTDLLFKRTQPKGQHGSGAS